MHNTHSFLAEPGSLGEHELDQVRTIYETSFSPALKEPFSHLAASIRGGETDLYLTAAESSVGGFAMVLPLGVPNVGYLSYFAVDPGQRGRGLGSALFHYLLADLHRRRGITELLWEVERPRACGTHACATPGDLDRRRIAFYRRQGGVLLDRVGDYRMPDLTGPGTLPAALMWTAIEDRPSLTRTELETYVAALFQTGYGRDLDDSLVQAVLRSLR